MSVTYTKLFSSLTESTVWVEPYPTRIVWVSMLAMADRNGRVWASVPGLARRAGVTLEECETALNRFQSPDKYSRTKEHEGRRIEPIDGGWRLLNYDKYRAQVDEESRKEYKREWDRTKRKKNDGESRNPTESDNIRQNRPQPTQAEAEAEAVKQSQEQAAPQVSATVAAPTPRAAIGFDDLRGYCIGARVTLDARGNAHLRQFIDEGMTEQQLRDAVAIARDKKPDPQPIPFAYLVPIIADIRAGRVVNPASYDAKAIRDAAIAAINAREGHATH